MYICMYVYILPIYEYVLLYTHTHIKCVAQFSFFKVRSYMGEKKLDGMIVCSEIIYAFSFIKDNLNFSGKYQCVNDVIVGLLCITSCVAFFW